MYLFIQDILPQSQRYKEEHDIHYNSLSSSIFLYKDQQSLILFSRNLQDSNISSITICYSSLLVLAAATLSVAAPAPAGPSPNNVFIDRLNYAGSGCGAGTVVYTTTSDKTAITLLFEEYIASIGPGSSIADSRKKCAVTLDVYIPSSFQFSITTVEYTGFENLGAGVSAVQAASYFFTGQSLPPVGIAKQLLITSANVF